METEKKDLELTPPTLVPSLAATMLDIPVGETRNFSCDTFSYVHVQAEATRLTKRAGDTSHRGRMFTASSQDKGKTISITRHW